MPTRLYLNYLFRLLGNISKIFMNLLLVDLTMSQKLFVHGWIWSRLLGSSLSLKDLAHHRKFQCQCRFMSMNIIRNPAAKIVYRSIVKGHTLLIYDNEILPYQVGFENRVCYLWF